MVDTITPPETDANGVSRPISQIAQSVADTDRWEEDRCHKIKKAFPQWEMPFFIGQNTLIISNQTTTKQAEAVLT